MQQANTEQNIHTGAGVTEEEEENRLVRGWSDAVMRRRWRRMWERGGKEEQEEDILLGAGWKREIWVWGREV